MNSYIVIEPKDIDEKVLIFNFLGSKSISKFTVTYDLKEYVSKLFRVKFIEENDSNMLANHQSGNGNQVQQTAANTKNGPLDNFPSTDDVSLSTTGMNNMDTVMTDLVPKTEEDANSVVPFHDTINNIPLIDNIVYLTTAASNKGTALADSSSNIKRVSFENGSQLNTRNEDEYGTYVPYRERMVEPKEEVIEDEGGRTVDVRMNRNAEEVVTSVDAMPIDDVLIPYRDRIVEPKEEITDDEMGVTVDMNNTEEIFTIADVMPIDDVLIPDIHNQQSIEIGNGSEVGGDIMKEEETVEDAQSTPITRIPGRITKRPIYSTDDKDTDDEDVDGLNNDLSLGDLTLTKRRLGRVVKTPKYLIENEEEDESGGTKPTKMGTNGDEKGVQCQKCLKQLSCRWYSDAKEHAIRHTDLMRYECPVMKCGFKSGYPQKINFHLKNHHKGLSVSAKELDLTTEQEEELLKITMECFPGFQMPNKQKTCTLCQTTIADNRVDQFFTKRHALSHIDMMLYKCNQSRCQYLSKHLSEMTKHGRKQHGIERMSKEDIAIELSDDQKKMIADIMKKCYPDEEDNGI